jgi:hypothetical protein
MIKEFLSVGLFLVITAASGIGVALLWRRSGRGGRATAIIGITAAYLILTYLISLWATRGGWPEGMFFMMAAVFVVPAAVVILVVLLIIALFGGEGGRGRRAGMIASFTVLAVIILALVFNKYLRLAWYWRDIDNPDPNDRAYAILMIGETGLKAAEPMILKAVHDPSPHVRADAILALASMDDPDTVPIVREALFDEDAEVRKMAVDVIVPLGRGGAEVVSDLKRMLDDPDPYVRDAAARGLDGIDRTWRAAPDVPEEYRNP